VVKALELIKGRPKYPPGPTLYIFKREIRMRFMAYFTWPLFLFRLAIVTILLPALVLISLFLTGMSYVDGKFEGDEDGFTDSFIETFTDMTGKCMMFLVGGRNIFKD